MSSSSTKGVRQRRKTVEKTSKEPTEETKVGESEPESPTSSVLPSSHAPADIQAEVVAELRGKILFRHELVFVLSCINVFATAFILGRWPVEYYKWHSIKAVVLMTTRTYTFFKQNYHMYLLDLCYFVNVLVMVYVWILPHNAMLFRIIFALSGTLTASIALFRNSLVLHSHAFMTSLWLHLSPPLMAWGIRWHATNGEPFTYCITDACSVSAFAAEHGYWGIFGPVFAFYAFWIIVHYSIVFVIKEKAVREQGLATLYASSSLRPLVALGGDAEWRRRAVYFGGHAVFAAISCIGAMIMWSHYWIHTLYLCAVMICSAWNGATFMFHVFSARYQDELKAKAEAKAQISFDGDAPPTIL
ncbi:uncharacterized protein AMSG_01533 [Thecamonas trahens ATCC 50062]|uniref:Glycerophosphocholine acyltransferase 1 n=1 Tax=Thecamonas trahens ATCC 50062 TaxID=461836 RepID=A0A0L0DQX3_THETB|nr:hypothetical protein AMSG_01533 [Thecamonas trahens ATCC 50062]KNC54682.1 hypothetical protein AMSG_01533 [Thecamonas trahens ATCC 50062]|eukprot:XP_013761584.1 hypothetical protein AMSG_01533 [Thecamonas trahens ATCC 50062]